MDLSRGTMKKLSLLILLAALAFTAVQWFDGVVAALRFLLGILSPFLLGAAIAFILNVPMRFLEKTIFSRLKSKPAAKRAWRIPPLLARALSLVLTLVLVVAVLLLLILVVVPELTLTIAGLGATIQTASARFLTRAEELFSSHPQIAGWLEELSFDWRSINWESVIGSVMDFLKNGAGDVLSTTVSAAMSVVSGVSNFLIAFVFACYILLQKEKLGLQCRKALYALLPRKGADRIMEICALSHRIFSGFITGQCTEAVILGAMFFLTMSILRMPYALLVSCLIAVMALIPIVGAFIGCAVGAFLMLMNSPLQALVFVLVFLLLQQIEGNLIYPHVVGNSVGLPSIWVLAAVILGGNLMGVGGMLLFIPLVSVLYSLFRSFVYRRLKEKNLTVT